VSTPDATQALVSHPELVLHPEGGQPERQESVLLALARTVEARDPYTRGHCVRVASYAVALGRALGLDTRDLWALDRAGHLHDLGKVGIPDRIVLKPGPLTRREWAIMSRHPVIGERICRPLRSLRRVLPIIRHHHERLDGSGYPDGLTGDAIPLTARVLQVVDIFDALTAARPYRGALSQTAALGVLREETARGWRDPQVVALFLKLMLANGPPTASISGIRDA